MADRGSEEVSIQRALRPLQGRAAVAAGSFVALLSLFHHVPVSVASLRGAAAFFVVLFVLKAGLFALEKSLAADRGTRGAEGAGEEAQS